MLILALNSGSSSLKCAAIDPQSGATPFSATLERIGSGNAVLKTLVVRENSKPETTTRTWPVANHGVALNAVLEALKSQPGLWNAIAGVGHRVVHGGEYFSASCLIDDEVVETISECSTLAPLHNPANLLGIEAARHALPRLPHVAVFDTAFHHGMPPRSYRYAIPQSWYENHGIRRYGFHGTSHRYVSARAAVELQTKESALNLITAHLGNGCSAAAIRGGVGVDTTMGFTPLEGLVMGTRSGDLDPGIVFHLVDHGGLSLEQVKRDLNGKSGLLGLSGLSNDMRELSEASEHDPRARLAIEVFCHRLAKHLAGLATNLEQTQALVFTGGIGQHSSRVRAAVCARLGCLGIRIDEEANSLHRVRIDAPGSAVAVLVLPTNEELMIAQDTLMFIDED